MNEYDSNRIYDIAKKIDYHKERELENIDCYVLNTCHIREKATEKVYHDIGRLKKIFRNKKKRSYLFTLVVACSGCEMCCWLSFRERSSSLSLSGATLSRRSRSKLYLSCMLGIVAKNDVFRLVTRRRWYGQKARPLSFCWWQARCTVRLLWLCLVG